MDLSFGFVFEKERLSKSYSITKSNSYEEEPPKPEKPEMLSEEIKSIFGQGKFKVKEKIDFYLGIRYDDSTYYGNVSTPRLGLIYYEKKFTLKLLYMKAFRAPKPWDYTDGLGNPNLKPEKINSLELANIWKISNNLQFETSLYKNHMKNLLVKEFIGDKWRWINMGEINTEGFEIFAIYKRGKIKGTFDYAYNNSTDENKKQIPEISKNIFGLKINYYIGKDSNFGLRLRYYGERKNPKIIQATGKDKVEDYFVLNGTFNFKFSKNFTGQIALDNLLNSVYYHTSNFLPDRYRQPGRSIRLKISYEY